MEEMDHVEDYPLLECIAPSKVQAVPAATARQSNILHFGHEEEGIGRSWIAQEDEHSLVDCTAPLQGQALYAVNVGQSNVQHSGRVRRGISSVVLDEVAHIVSYCVTKILPTCSAMIGQSFVLQFALQEDTAQGLTQQQQQQQLALFA